MKAAVIHEYGSPDELKFEDMPDPSPGPGEVLIGTAATSINPLDVKMRSGAVKEYFPVSFPAILGWVVSGTVEKVGPGVVAEAGTVREAVDPPWAWFRTGG